MDDSAQVRASDSKSQVSTSASLNNKENPTISGEREIGGDLSEAQMMSEIREVSKEIDEKALGEVRAQIQDVESRNIEPELPKEVESAGVFSPQKAASEVIEKGPTMNIPFSGNVLKLDVKVKGAVFKKSVVGVASVAALAIWIGRMVKLAHKHTMRVVFKATGNKSKTPEGSK